MWVEWVVRSVMSWWCYDVVDVFVWVEWGGDGSGVVVVLICGGCVCVGGVGGDGSGVVVVL